MKWLSIAILVMVAFAFSPAKSAEAADFSFSVGFHDELSPYGTWVNYSSYGNVWRPYGYSGWRPYMDGYWGQTSYGPTWYGNEPYAPYVYHYGNWIYTARYGWVWIPGYDYHPGRVDWSYGGGYIGWRPQFPGGYHYPGSDYNFWVVIDSNRFGYNSYRPYILGTTRVRDLFARRIFRQRYDNFRLADLQRVVRRPIRRLDVREREIRIGDRRARILATANDEVRIRKHVTQVRGLRDRRDLDRRDVVRRDVDRREIDRREIDRRDVDRRGVERDTVMKRKFEDIRKGSSSKSVRKSDDVRKDSRSKSVEKSRVDKSRDSRKFESKSKSSRKPSKIEKRSNEKPNKSSLSFRKSDRDSHVRKASVSSRKPSKVEKARFSVRKSEVRSHGTKAQVSKVRSSGKKAEVSKAKRTTTKREPARKQKPRKNY